MSLLTRPTLSSFPLLPSPISPLPQSSPLSHPSPLQIQITEMEYGDDEYVGLPNDFDINAPIPILTDMFKRLPLTTYFYELVKRFEKEKTKKDGRTYILCLYVSIH